MGAARAILSDQGPADVSIQQITDRADVGFGSFYNHFTSKAELFEAAVADTLEEYATLLEERTARLDDPAESFAVGVRLTGRLAETHPEVARILLRTGMNCLHEECGLTTRATRDIELAVAAGSFRVANSQVALAGVAGALLGLVELTLSRPDGAGPEVCEEMAELMLRMLGMAPDDAHEVARRPLPGEHPVTAGTATAAPRPRAGTEAVGFRPDAGAPPG
ncbi:TetR family transcriptional regulator [Streptomyces sp. SAJ15]|nr:TetR family transcriptional regulator [Streptomyces sp. SAJ15]